MRIQGKEITNMSQTEKELKIIIIKEGLAQSLIADTYSFSIPILLLFLNAWYWGNTWIIQVFVIILWFIWMISRRNEKIKTFYSKENAIKYLSKETEAQND